MSGASDRPEIRQGDRVHHGPGDRLAAKLAQQDVVARGRRQQEWHKRAALALAGDGIGPDNDGQQGAERGDDAAHVIDHLRIVEQAEFAIADQQQAEHG